MINHDALFASSTPQEDIINFFTDVLTSATKQGVTVAAFLMNRDTIDLVYDWMYDHSCFEYCDDDFSFQCSILGIRILENRSPDGVIAMSQAALQEIL